MAMYEALKIAVEKYPKEVLAEVIYFNHFIKAESQVKKMKFPRKCQEIIRLANDTISE